MKIIFTLLLALCTMPGMAVDNKATLECVYQLTYQTDTVKHRTTKAVMVLRLGESQSLFYSEARFEIDSLELLASSPRDVITTGDTVRVTRKGTAASYYVLKDFQKENLQFVGRVWQTYKYTEPMPSFDWQLTDEKKTIGTHQCQKAVCSYGGRTYEAWFAPDIPINDGPWKFHGLPGLIIEVYDTQHHYEFTFLGMRPCNGNIAIPIDGYVKTTKTKYLRTKQLSIDDPNAILSGISASIGIKGDKVPKRFAYKTMELTDATSSDTKTK